MKSALTGPMRILRRWLGTYPELPIIQLAPVMDDDDVEAWNDIVYLRQLIDDIARDCTLDTHLPGIPPEWSAELDAALELVRCREWFPREVAA